MSLDTADTVKSTFGSLKTDAGKKVLGLLFAVQLVNMASSYLAELGTAMMAVSGLVALVTGLAMIVITVGAFRSLDEGIFRSQHYTENLVWPAIRITGANAVIAVFAYGLGLLAMLPALGSVGLTGIGASATGAGLGSSILVAALGILGLLLGAGVFFYIFLMLTVAVPMIAIDDNRIFQSLDRSVQRTKGEKSQMLFSALPVGLLYLLGVILVVASGAAGVESGTPSLISVPVSAAVGSLTATLVFSLLTEYHQRLPE